MKFPAFPAAVLALCAVLLGACSPASSPAPTVEIDIGREHIEREQFVDTSLVRPEKHIVLPGENLIEIATSYGMSYKDVARWNNIPNPDKITAGQRLNLYPPKYEASVTPVAQSAGVAVRPILRRTTAEQEKALRKSAAPDALKKEDSGVRRQQIVAGTTAEAPATTALVTQPVALKLPYSERDKKKLRDLGPGDVRQASLLTTSAAKPPAAVRKARGIQWSWPAKGAVIAGYSSENRGLDISGERGEPVQASADGKVIYVGSGVKGFGQIVIIRHVDEYVSLYAHNDKIFVAEGDKVVRGGQIAAMGDTGTDRVGLHFQIRRGTKVFDPRKFLPKSGR